MESNNATTVVKILFVATLGLYSATICLKRRKFILHLLVTSLSGTHILRFEQL